MPFLAPNHSLVRNEHKLLTAKQLKGRSEAQQSGIYHLCMEHGWETRFSEEKWIVPANAKLNHCGRQHVAMQLIECSDWLPGCYFVHLESVLEHC